jgi:hypothetical protein
LLKNFVGGESTKMVDNIIQEEVRHVLRLNNFKSENIPEAPDVDAM